jgi:hypothetical protein
MTKPIDLVKLSFCGPSDVMKEIAIAQDVVKQWNLHHGEARGFWIKHQHWSSDSHPEMGDRPQAIINRQVIDDSDIIVAIFWQRFGSPTGVAASGTEEEIRRATRLDKKVMVYFSDLESVAGPADLAQAQMLADFRRNLREKRQGLYGTFSSRDQFRNDFARNLAHAINKLRPQATNAAVAPTQSIEGDGNVQIGGDLNLFATPPVLKTVVERRPGAVSSAEARQLQLWIEELSESTMGATRDRAFGMWWQRFKNRFEVEKYEELMSSAMPEVKEWFVTQRAIQKRGLKTKLPDDWKKERIISIKAAMRQMGRDKEDYYPEIAQRLKIKGRFTSLNDLSKKDMERAYTLVRRDAQGI